MAKVRKAGSVSLSGSLSSQSFGSARRLSVGGAHAATSLARKGEQVVFEASRAGQSRSAASAWRGEDDSEGSRETTRAAQAAGKAPSAALSRAGRSYAKHAEKLSLRKATESGKAYAVGDFKRSKALAKKSNRAMFRHDAAGKGAAGAAMAGRTHSRGVSLAVRYGDGQQDATQVVGRKVEQAGYRAAKAGAKQGTKGAVAAGKAGWRQAAKTPERAQRAYHAAKGAPKKVKAAYEAGRVATKAVTSALKAIGATLGSAVGAALAPIAGVFLGILVVLMAALLAISAFFSGGEEGGTSFSYSEEEWQEIITDAIGELPDITPEDAQAHAFGVLASEFPEWNTDEEKTCLVGLWEDASGWNYKKYDAEAHAYGLWQVAPANGMSSAGADWLENPATQARWGLQYMKDNETSPCGLWSPPEGETESE